MSTANSWGIHWFRRDLRVAGNPALHWSYKRHQGRVVGLFCFDSRFLGRPDFSHNRFAFFLATLKELQNEMRAIGSDLLAVDCEASDAFIKLHAHFKKKELCFETVSFNRDYEPYARERDTKVTALLKDDLKVEVHTERDHLLIEPHEILKSGSSESSFYQVFTPYARQWFDRLNTPDVQNRLAAQNSGFKYLMSQSQGKVKNNIFALTWKKACATAPPLTDALQSWIDKNQPSVTIEIPKAGSLEAVQRLSSFKDRLEDYGKQRNIPGCDGTSRLSIYLKNGSLTVPQIIAALELSNANFLQENSRTKFLKELTWREFYYQILYHRPDVENLEFITKYRGLQWENNQTHFKAWQDGMTGYPIIDAGMRQLKKEGWMHNRVRMIVASFLTKDLLIDWRWGERHFMKELLDGDMAPNNGGWQWAASTGCDPQPYFRVFNPELQSLKFDPDGDYIRRYVPELSLASSKQIHAPDKFGDTLLEKLGYPAPIVSHASQKHKAMALYKGRLES